MQRRVPNADIQQVAALDLELASWLVLPHALGRTERDLRTPLVVDCRKRGFRHDLDLNSLRKSSFVNILKTGNLERSVLLFVRGISFAVIRYDDAGGLVLRSVSCQVRSVVVFRIDRRLGLLSQFA